MENLPIEVIEQIMSDKTLTLSDVTNTLQTCKRLKSTIEGSNYIWKHVFVNRWPYIFSSIEPEEITDWFDEVKHIINLEFQVVDQAVKMASQFLYVKTFFYRDFKEWDSMINQRKFNDVYVLYLLSSIIKNKCAINSIKMVPLTTPGNLTLIYYSQQALHYLNDCKSVRELKELMRLPENSRTLEKCATLIAKSFQAIEGIKYEKIRKILDKLSLEAQDELRTINPHHPLFAISENEQMKWKDQNLSESVFKEDHALQVFQAVNRILYEKYNFNNLKNNPSTYYCIPNSYIDKVLETGFGLPILLSIIYESVCRRLGIKCVPLNTPQHFSLKCVNSEDSRRVFYIDAYNDGNITIIPVSKKPENRYDARSVDVMLRMLNNLSRLYEEAKFRFEFRLLYKFKMLLTPSTYAYIAEFTNFFYQQTFRPTPNSEVSVFEMLEEEIYEKSRSLDMEEKYFTKGPKYSPEKKFPVGAIVKRKLTNVKGVIVGATCIFVEQKNWPYQRDQCRLDPLSETFYFVLYENGLRGYIGEECLALIDNPTPLPDHVIEVGKYFSHFFINHYVPNTVMNSFYHQEEEFREKHYQTLYLKNKTCFES